MELFNNDFWSSLVAILVIDLVLAGDNALVIGMAARELPKHQQKQAIVWGTVGAIILRVLATLFVVWLLKIPGFLFFGGLLLFKIAFQLAGKKKADHNLRKTGSLWSAIKTIMVADAVMGIDNVLAVAGAANGSFLIVLLGLIISIPIVVWGSGICIRLLDRFPALIYIGAGVIVWTGAKMIFSEPFVQRLFI